MSSVNEWIVREYLESLGFLVRQPRKYQVVARSKGLHEEVDLLAVNPALPPGRPLPKAKLWGAAELAQVSCAIVAVRGWHTERFSPAVMELSSEIFRLTDSYVLQKAEEMMGPGPVTKILCLPELPATKELRERALQMLRDKAQDLFRSKGIDGVILFRTMLRELADYVDSNKNYEKSDLLQTLRLLKNYDLLKDAQMELFRRKRKPRKSES